MYIYTHIYISEVGIVSPIGKSFRFVRACVRACERARRGEAKLCAPVRRCCFRGWVADAQVVLRRMAWRGVARGVAWPPLVRSCVEFACLSSLFDKSIRLGDER